MLGEQKEESRAGGDRGDGEPLAEILASLFLNIKHLYMYISENCAYMYISENCDKMHIPVTPTPSRQTTLPLSFPLVPSAEAETA